jgi:hypothetical protein
MNRRMQIIVSSRPAAGSPGITPPLSFWQRFKMLITGLGIAVLAGAVVVAALVLGSILVALVGLVLVAVIVYLVIKATFRRARS